MPCYHPLQAWRGRMQPNGKRSVVFQASQREQSLVDPELQLPCGQCVGCRLERSRQWAMRCVQEAQLHDRNCFVTLTYDESHLPGDGSLSIRDFQLFMKRLRKAAGVPGIRFFHCGEYGSKLDRPHYHACLFNWDFDDKVLWSIRDDVRLYRSALLESLWPFGFSTVGDVTYESAAYVARYVLKKVNGEAAAEHYVDKLTGVVRQPEYVTMSRRPGIGRGWYDRYKFDMYPEDYYVVRGMKVQPPKFYDGLYELEDPEQFRILKNRRSARGRLHGSEYHRHAGEVITNSRLAQLKRTLED